MLIAILVFSVLTTIFTMACAGHLSNLEKLTKSLVEAKLAELKMFNGDK